MQSCRARVLSLRNSRHVTSPTPEPNETPLQKTRTPRRPTPPSSGSRRHRQRCRSPPPLKFTAPHCMHISQTQTHTQHTPHALAPKSVALGRRGGARIDEGLTQSQSHCFLLSRLHQITHVFETLQTQAAASAASGLAHWSNNRGPRGRRGGGREFSSAGSTATRGGRPFGTVLRDVCTARRYSTSTEIL
jgi:hypothetical protein